jgi:predicted ester cyclase
MSAHEQTAAVRRYAEEIWGQGNLNAIDEVFSPNFVRHGPEIEGGDIRGREGVKQLVTMYRTAFPDLKVPIEAQFGSGDTAVTRWRALGTNQGPMLGLDPTGKPVNIGGTWIHNFQGSQIAEEWVTYDTFAILRQMGIFSLPGQGGG